MDTNLTTPPSEPRRTRGRPTLQDSLALKILRQQELAARRRQNLATQRSHSKKRQGVFQRAYAKWLATLSPEDAARCLRESHPADVRIEAKKQLFLELYKDMWPDKIACLAFCGLTLSWLKDKCTRDPEFGAELLAIELNRLDTLKAFSYEQSFHPQNVAERIFWLKTIGRDEFGDDPLVNITNINANQSEGFDKLEALLKRRNELAKQRETLLAHSEPAELAGPGSGTSEPQQ